MKKIFAVILTIVLILSAPFLVSANITDESDVGKTHSDIFINFGDITTDGATQSIINEYNRAIKTRSVLHQGYGYFDYGNSGEKDCYWVNITVSQFPVPEMITIYVQDFTEGFSASGTTPYGSNWCKIVATPYSVARGEAYTVRDGIANGWGNSGEQNGEWGLPISNQYWIGNTCYQQFEKGYASAVNGTENVLFYKYTESAPPAISEGSFDYDFGVPESELNPPVSDEPSIEPVSEPDSIDSSDEISSSSSEELSSQDVSSDADISSSEVSAVVSAGNSSVSPSSAAYALTTDKDNTARKAFIIISVIVLIIAAGIVAYVVMKKRRPNPYEYYQRNDDDDDEN